MSMYRAQPDSLLNANAVPEIRYGRPGAPVPLYAIRMTPQVAAPCDAQGRRAPGTLHRGTDTPTPGGWAVAAVAAAGVELS